MSQKDKVDETAEKLKDDVTLIYYLIYILYIYNICIYIIYIYNFNIIYIYIYNFTITYIYIIYIIYI